MPDISPRPSLVANFSLSDCVPLWPSLYLYIHLLILSIHPYIHHPSAPPSYLSFQTYTIHLATYPAIHSFIQCPPNYLPIHPPFCPFSHQLFIHSFTYLSIHPFTTHPCTHHSIYPSIHYPSICPIYHPSISNLITYSLCIHISTYLSSICLPIQQSVHTFIYLYAIYPSISPFIHYLSTYSSTHIVIS